MRAGRRRARARHTGDVAAVAQGPSAPAGSVAHVEQPWGYEGHDPTDMGPGSRDYGWALIALHINEAAVDVVAAHGHAALTHEAVADASGMPPEMVRRHARNLWDTLAPWPDGAPYVVAGALAGRPHDPVWEVLVEELVRLAGAPFYAGDRGRHRARIGTRFRPVLERQPHEVWTSALARHVAARLTGPDAMLRATVLVDTAALCFTRALAAWSEPGEQRPLVDVVRRALATVSPTP